MFYRALVGGSLAVFGGVFFLTGAATTSPPPGHVIAKPVEEVYAAVSDVEELFSGEPNSELADLNLPSVELIKSAPQSITWKAKSGAHRTFDLTLRLTPSPDRKSTYASLELVEHALPADFKVGEGFMGPDLVKTKISLAVAEQMADVDPTFAAQIKSGAVEPSMVKGVQQAYETRNNWEAAAKMGADMAAEHTEAE